MHNHVELATAAQRDLRRLGPGMPRERILAALSDELTAVPQPENLDIKAIVGAAPWLRLRIGDYRVLYRPLTAAELAELARRHGSLDGPEGFLVQRVIHRRDLERAVAALP
jgi:mRNA-degrading endonuclease RelE of RelBE toxin-antitoxin system